MRSLDGNQVVRELHLPTPIHFMIEYLWERVKLALFDDCRRRTFLGVLEIRGCSINQDEQIDHPNDGNGHDY